MPEQWYEPANDRELRQGELLWQCSRVRLPETDFSEKAEITVESVHAVVLTQSCDLIPRKSGKPKADVVLLCPFHTMSELGENATFKDKQAWENCRKGMLPRFHVLNTCEFDGQSDFLLVDLGAAFSLDYSVVLDNALQNRSRLRLKPPYREHLSQAFARYYMRVGLPTDIPEFV